MESQVSRFGRLDAPRLKAIEDENRRLKKLLAEAILDNAMLRISRQKNGDARSLRSGYNKSAT